MKKIFIIGVTGENSSGKGSISEFIKNNFPDYNPIICNTREKILEIAEQEGVDLSDRPALSKFSNDYAETYGGDVYCSFFYNNAITNGHKILVVDSVRRIDEVNFIKKNNGIIMSVTAPIEKRFEWAKARGSVTDKKITTLEQFRELDFKENAPDPWLLNLRETMNQANVTLRNAGTKEHFQKLIKSYSDIVLKMKLDEMFQSVTHTLTSSFVSAGHGGC